MIAKSRMNFDHRLRFLVFKPVELGFGRLEREGCRAWRVGLVGFVARSKLVLFRRCHGLGLAGCGDASNQSSCAHLNVSRLHS